MFIRLDRVPACDRRTDRQTDRGTDRRNCCRYYSALHCMQCGRAVKIAQNSRRLSAVRSVEPIVANFRRKSFSVPFVSFPVSKKFVSCLLTENSSHSHGFYQKFIFKLSTVNFNTWTKVKLSWIAMCHSYDVIKQLSKQITCDGGVFISVSIDERIIKID